MFRRLYVLDNGRKKDILKNGQLSCAVYVSSILKLFNLISKLHTTVKSTLDDMRKNGWRPTKKLQAGNVLLWEEKKQADGEFHQHLGFYLGQNRAISNRDEKRAPTVHHFTYGRDKNNRPKRKIVQIFTHRIIKEEW